MLRTDEGRASEVHTSKKVRRRKHAFDPCHEEYCLAAVQQVTKCHFAGPMAFSVAPFKDSTGYCCYQPSSAHLGALECKTRYAVFCCCSLQPQPTVVLSLLFGTDNYPHVHMHLRPFPGSSIAGATSFPPPCKARGRSPSAINTVGSQPPRSPERTHLLFQLAYPATRPSSLTSRRKTQAEAHPCSKSVAPTYCEHFTPRWRDLLVS